MAIRADAAERGPVSSPAPPRAPARVNLPDRAWGVILTALGATVLIVAGLIIASLLRLSTPALAKTSVIAFVTGRTWDVTRDIYGALPYIYGTLVTSAVGLVLA